MPFTLSHAVAALPSRRTRLIPSAVVIGCFAPDLEYFARLAPRGGLGHTFPGMFVLDLPLAFGVLWLFHRYAKEPLWASLPRRIRQRIELGPRSLPIHNPRRMLLIAISILVGAATHIVWDSFTHDSFWPYRNLPILSRTLQLPVGGEVPYYKVLQHASSVLGLAAIGIWWILWYRSAGRIHSREAFQPVRRARTTFLILSVIALTGATIRTVVAVETSSVVHTQEVVLAEEIITAIAFFWIELVVYGFIRHRAAKEARTV